MSFMPPMLFLGPRCHQHSFQLDSLAPQPVAYINLPRGSVLLLNPCLLTLFWSKRSVCWPCRTTVFTLWDHFMLQGTIALSLELTSWLCESQDVIIKGHFTLTKIMILLEAGVCGRSLNVYLTTSYQLLVAWPIWVMCCLMTSGLRKEFDVMCGYTGLWVCRSPNLTWGCAWTDIWPLSSSSGVIWVHIGQYTHVYHP